MDQMEADSRRILIVDDNRRIYEDFQAILADDTEHVVLDRQYQELFAPDGSQPAAPRPPTDFELLYAAQGQDACKMVERLQQEGKSVALAFVDMRMPPGWDGLGAITALWRCDPRMEIVICTAYSDHTWEEITARLGRTDRFLILKKPFDIVEVAQLTAALTTKWRQTRKAEWNTAQLEEMVATRTRELEAAKAQIARYSNQLSAILDWLPVGILIYDPSRACVHDANMIAMSVMGLPREQITNRRMEEVLVSVQSQASLETLLAGQTSACEDRLIVQHGRRVPILRTTFPVVLQGRQYVLISFLDISDTKRVDEQRRQLEERKRQAEKMKSLFVMAGSVAHNFNNLLQAVTGYIDLAMLEIQPTDVSLLDNLQDAQSAAQRAAELSALMLTYVGQGHFPRQKAQINHIVLDAVNALPRDRQHQVQCFLDDNLPPVRIGGPQIRQCVENILSNSLDAISETTGAIKISTCQRHCDHNYIRQTVLGDESSEGHYVVIEISDNGMGMDPETMAKVFDPFFSTKMIGRGLGLAVVLGIMRSHSGAVTVYSEPGQGTMMRLLLPCPEGPAEAASAGFEWRNDDGLMRGGVTLVVDDEAIIREITCHMLERMGFEVLTAEDGKEALRIFYEHQDQINVVLLDVLMPEMSGPETLEALRKTHPHIPVIIISGYDQEKALDKFGSLQISEFLQKPFNASQLEGCLRDIFK